MAIKANNNKDVCTWSHAGETDPLLPQTSRSSTVSTTPTASDPEPAGEASALCAFIHLLPGLCASIHATTWLCFFGVVGMVAFLVWFQIFLIPWIHHKSSDSLYSLALVIGVPSILDHLVDLLWVKVTNDTDQFLHARLGDCAELKAANDGDGGSGSGNMECLKGRDALRKCENLSEIVRIIVTKVSIIFVSLSQGFWVHIGPWAMCGSALLICANLLLRQVTGQRKSVDWSWGKRLVRNNEFNNCKKGGIGYTVAWKDYKSSTIRRSWTDNLRDIAWEVCLFLGFLGYVRACAGTASVPIFAKMLKDAYSLDGHLDKIVKSSVNVEVLLRWCHKFDQARPAPRVSEMESSVPEVDSVHDNVDAQTSSRSSLQAVHELVGSSLPFAEGSGFEADLESGLAGRREAR